MTTHVVASSKTRSIPPLGSSRCGVSDDVRQDAPSPGLVLAKIPERAPTETEIAQKQYILQLQMLARQLEYYFSKQNLSSDTYLNTLRGLNDGCVPVTILSNFAKVKAILGSKGGEPSVAEEEARMHAILQAASEYSDLLQVHSIDTATGKIATDETPSSAITILAVGPVSEDSSPMVESIPSVRCVENASSNSNTIILRDVGDAVTEEEVRGLLDGLDCPPVISVTSDVANSWFIAFDTLDRTELMNIMMQLRSKTYPSTGEYVMARLRASVVTSAPVDVYSTLPVLGTGFDAATRQPTKKKKKKKRPKKKNKSASKKGSSEMKTSAAGSTAETKQSAVPPPPSLTEDHFPSLQDEKVEWEVDNSMRDDDSVDDEASEDSTKNDEEDEERKSVKGCSDGASTATTTSSTATTSSTFDSISKKQPIVGGYAAALLKTAPPRPSASVQASEESPSTKAAAEKPTDVEERVVEDSKAGPAPVVITSPPTWGGGRSFAETIRKKDEQILGGKLVRKK